jgi:uncharacterized protein YbbC (DUF1343 family)
MPIDIIAGDRDIREALEQQRPVDELESSWQADLQAFTQQARHYHLYH